MLCGLRNNLQQNSQERNDDRKLYEKMTTQQKPSLGFKETKKAKENIRRDKQFLFPFQAHPVTPTNHFSFEVKQHVLPFFPFVFLSFKREVMVWQWQCLVRELVKYFSRSNLFLLLYAYSNLDSQGPCSNLYPRAIHFLGSVLTEASFLFI